MDTSLRMHEIFRQPGQEKHRYQIGEYRNILAVTRGGDTFVPLDAGINPIATVGVGDGSRCPAILLRSSPWKAGTASTPWHDVFDLDHGHVRYYGDHKATTARPLGSTPGNKALFEQMQLHQSAASADRMRATPLVLFRSVTVDGKPKGHLEFCGLGVLERAELVVQWDERVQRSYPNFVFDVAVLDLGSEDEQLDWAWVNARRDSTRTNHEVLRLAPKAWRQWVREGHAALPRVRRQVSRNRIMTAAEQLPRPSTPEFDVLNSVYGAFDGKKACFEVLASQIAGRVIGGESGRYHQGWLTQPSGDRGVDFVGRLDAGSEDSTTHLVVLGQAKCIAPQTKVTAEQLSRVVARLKRGWLGAYVTTGTYSKNAQVEMIEDDYPIVLVHGLRLAREVRLMAYESYGGRVEDVIQQAIHSHTDLISHRRPEEILLM